MRSDYVKAHAPYNQAAINGMNKWENATNSKVNFTGLAPEGTLNEARFFCKTESNNANAYTVFVAKVSDTYQLINPNLKNWDYCRIYFNPKYMDSMTVSKASVVAAHELGHLLGLDDNNQNKNYITCQAGSGRTATIPHKDEVGRVNSKNG